MTVVDEWPKVDAEGVTIWACCVSGIGPMCNHWVARLGLEPSKAWVVEYKIRGRTTRLTMHRWPCNDRRYSWGLRGRCPICGEHDVHEFFVSEPGELEDTDVVQRRLESDIETTCHHWQETGVLW